VIIDTSALCAMLYEEEDAPDMERALALRGECGISAATLVEAYMICEGRGGADAAARLDALLGRISARVIPFTAEHAALAREGFRRFGKGRHPAGLNFGDCFAYALARARHEPLLFKGDDFAQTDVKAAL
jgi:ribonuclease VapC